MRTEREMTALILGVAERDSRVRAVFMNGSRANPNAPRDIFQDYDIVYVVEETASFRAQPGWVDVFGERLVMQTPDEMDHAAGQPTDLEVWACRFCDVCSSNDIFAALLLLTHGSPSSTPAASPLYRCFSSAFRQSAPRPFHFYIKRQRPLHP